MNTSQTDSAIVDRLLTRAISAGTSNLLTIQELLEKCAQKDDVAESLRDASAADLKRYIAALDTLQERIAE
jgi:hypothetical protein